MALKPQASGFNNADEICDKSSIITAELGQFAVYGEQYGVFYM
jgi:hypothetical protein